MQRTTGTKGFDWVGLFQAVMCLLVMLVSAIPIAFMIWTLKGAESIPGERIITIVGLVVVTPLAAVVWALCVWIVVARRQKRSEVSLNDAVYAYNQQRRS